jgi:glutamate/tyrosine decarboxylase-like PLP-dependent enzyme
MKKESMFPESGKTGHELTSMLSEHKTGDAQWNDGRTFGFVYHPGEQFVKIAETYQEAFRYESTLNPSAFPSLRKFEKEVIGMARELVHGDRHVAGSVTTGGTESIFLSMKVARDLAMEKGKKDLPFEVILPETAHPAFLKASHYLSLKPVIVPVDSNFQADPVAMENAIHPNTILLACSAPCFPCGVLDPVRRLGKIALKHGLLLHVDACMGGFMLPFMEDLGYPVPEFDFRVPGVSSISLDAHKYGYAPKGVSIILYRNRKLRRKQFFIHTEWSGGIFASTTFSGTRSGGPLAGCWAIMNHLGREGYRSLAFKVMESTRIIREGIEDLEDLQIVGDPDMSLLAFTSREGNIYNIGDALAGKGWYLDRLQFPEGLHLTITQLNAGKEKEFLSDLREVLANESSLRHARKGMEKSVRWVDRVTSVLPGKITDRVARIAGSHMKDPKTGDRGSQAALYGISATFDNRIDVRRLVENLLDGMY